MQPHIVAVAGLRFGDAHLRARLDDQAVAVARQEHDGVGTGADLAADGHNLADREARGQRRAALQRRLAADTIDPPAGRPDPRPRIDGREIIGRRRNGCGQHGAQKRRADNGTHERGEHSRLVILLAADTASAG